MYQGGGIVLKDDLEGVVCQYQGQAGAQHRHDHHQHVDDLLEAEHGREEVPGEVVVAEHEYSYRLALKYI